MNADPEPVVGCIVRQEDQAEICPVHPNAMAVNCIEFAFLSKETGFGE
jgi:hypothetical protein